MSWFDPLVYIAVNPAVFPALQDGLCPDHGTQLLPAFRPAGRLDHRRGMVSCLECVESILTQRGEAYRKKLHEATSAYTGWPI